MSLPIQSESCYFNHVKHEFETNVDHEKPESEPYCFGGWRPVINEEDPTHPVIVRNERGSAQKPVEIADSCPGTAS